MIQDSDLDLLVTETARHAARAIYQQGHWSGQRVGEDEGFRRGCIQTAGAVDEVLTTLEETGGPTVQSAIRSIRDALRNLLRADPSTPLEDLNISVRAYNPLKRGGYHTIADLVTLTDAQMRDNLRGLGTKSQRELDEALARMGHKRGEPIDW